MAESYLEGSIEEALWSLVQGKGYLAAFFIPFYLANSLYRYS